VWHARCHLEECLSLTKVSIEKRIDSTGATLDAPLAMKSSEELGIETLPVEVARPNDPTPAQ
jgi:hypothetical protein